MLDILPAAVRRTIEAPAPPQTGHERERLPAIGDHSPDLFRCGRDAHGRTDAAARMGGIDRARGDHDFTRREALLYGGVCHPGALRVGRSGLEQ